MSKRIPIILGLLLVAIAIWLLITPSRTIRQFIERLELLSYDVQLRTRVLTHPIAPSKHVAIIDIDDRSLQAIGRWPWPRKILAKLVEELDKAGPSVIAFDMFFAEPQPNLVQEIYTTLKKKAALTPNLANTLKQKLPLFEEDNLFAQSFQDANVVLALGFLPRAEFYNQLPDPILQLAPSERSDLTINSANGYISNVPVLQQAAKGAGFINIFPDNDGIIRRAPLLMQYQGKVYPSLALQAVMSLLSEDISLITPAYGKRTKLEGIKLGSLVIPTDDKGQMLIPFIGRSFTFPYYSAYDVLQGNVPEQDLIGKILFIGTSATGLGDLKATAIQNPFPGVEIQATLVNGILQQHFSYQPAWTYGANIFITFLVGLFCAFIFPYLGPRTLSLGMLIFPPVVTFVNSWLWQETGLILSFFLPILLFLSIALLNIIYGYLFETRKRERLKAMFGQYVPAKHIDEMLLTESDYALRGEDREMSVLFADIRNFTHISEGMPANELVELLNTFFTPMTEIIFNHGGTIDKYVGDLIMAFWGAPLKDPEHSTNALKSAIEMKLKLTTLHEMLAKRHWPALKIGIGINSGTMIVGDMGSKFRRNYTVLGDSVNLASRIEGLTKFYGVDVIVSETTAQGQAKFLFLPLDKVRVKGKSNSITLYQLLGYQADLTAELKYEIDTFEQALKLYYQRLWLEAENLLLQLNKQNPGKKLYEIYLNRIQIYKTQSVPDDWDGVFVHETK